NRTPGRPPTRRYPATCSIAARDGELARRGRQGPRVFRVRPSCSRQRRAVLRDRRARRRHRGAVRRHGVSCSDGRHGFARWTGISLPRPQGDGYYAVIPSEEKTTVTDQVTVFADDYVPPQSFYDSQVLPIVPAGQPSPGYIQARDGTLLSAQVELPAGPWPFPVLFEY